ncbi:hypothetical protein Tco_0943773 [Tanacetum coccineum]
MVAPVISISSDTSEESMGSHAPRVILFGAIPAIIPEVPIVLADLIVAPDVGAVPVVSPTRVLDLVDYSSSSDSDPLEDSLPHRRTVKSVPAEQRPVSSSLDTLAPSSEFLLAPIVAPPRIRRRSTTLIRPGEAIHFGRPYRTHPNGPRKLLTVRKRVRPLPARRLSWRRVSHHSSDHHSSPESSSFGLPSDSLSDPSSVHSSGCDSSGQAHSGPSTRDVSPRLVYPPVLTPQYSEAFRRWRAAPLSTPYPPTTSESSLGSSSERSLDSSSPSSGPSPPTPADLLPPRKRFRDSYSPEDSREEHMEVGTADAEAIADLGISEGVVAHTGDGVGMRVGIAASDVREDDEEFEPEARDVPDHGTTDGAIDITYETLRDIVKRFHEHAEEIPVHQIQQDNARLRDTLGRERVELSDRILSLRLEYLKIRAMLSIKRDQIDSIRWHMALSQEEFRQVRRDRDDARRRLRRTMTITRSGMTPEAIEELINRRVEEAMAAYEEARDANALEAENQSQNGSDGDNRNSGNGNGGNGNGGNGNGRNENPKENGRGDRPVARECTYQDFIKCQPLTFKGTEGVVGLTRWFENVTPPNGAWTETRVRGRDVIIHITQDIKNDL